MIARRASAIFEIEYSLVSNNKNKVCAGDTSKLFVDEEEVMLAWVAHHRALPSGHRHEKRYAVTDLRTGAYVCCSHVPLH